MKEESRLAFDLIKSLLEEDVQKIIVLSSVPNRITEKTRGDTAELIFALRMTGMDSMQKNFHKYSLVYAERT